MLIKLLNTLLMIAVAISITGVINRTRAVWAGRKGIRFFQHVYNARLMLRKGAVYSPTTTALFRIAPTVYLGAAIVAFLFKEELFGLIADNGTELEIELDLSLARGLNYYTGAIFEVKAKDYQIGSICGGGRYDDLTGIFGLPDTSGVGISFGADRIYDVLNQLELYPADSTQGSKIIFLHFGDAEKMYALPWLNALRKQGISAEIYPDKEFIEKNGIEDIKKARWYLDKYIEITEREAASNDQSTAARV